MSSWVDEQEPYRAEFSRKVREPAVRLSPSVVGFTACGGKPVPGIRSWTEPSAGRRVRHRVFGDGTVCSYERDRHVMRVDFDGKPKSFLFPDAFACGFLEYIVEAGA